LEASCESPHIRAKVALSIGREEPWEDAEPRTSYGKTIYLARKPVLTNSAITALRLMKAGDRRYVELSLTPEGRASRPRPVPTSVAIWSPS
jgi:hypothetical protein